MRKADNLPTSCAVVTKSGNLNFLEPSGPVQARNGAALPLPLPILKMNISFYIEICDIATDTGCVKLCLQYGHKALRNCMSHMEFLLGLHYINGA